jgi:FKBP-type peptidyl-prolyl cis-trans isomerase
MKTVFKVKFLSSLASLLFLGGLAVAADDPAFETLEGGMKARTLQEGEGPTAEQGQVATIHFIGWLDDAGVRGRELYNSYREGKPVSFVIGTDRIMPAWSVGIVGMRPGGKRMLLVPSAMGYGAHGVQDLVPGNAPLIFQVELVGLEGAPGD